MELYIQTVWRGSAATRFLVFWVRILLVDVSVSCKCCVLSGRGFWVGLITRPEESYRVWCVWVWRWSLDTEKTLAKYKELLRPGEKKYTLPRPLNAFTACVGGNVTLLTVFRLLRMALNACNQIRDQAAYRNTVIPTSQQTLQGNFRSADLRGF
jgi:hypothetical protein